MFKVEVMWSQHYVILISTLIMIVYSIPSRKMNDRKGITDEIFIVKGKPKCAINNNTLTYCENLDTYPTEYLRNGIKNKDYYHLFGEPIYEFADRFFNDDGDDLCLNRRLTIYPKIAVNTKKQWRYIYNFENYIQGIQIEVCVNRDSCNLLGILPTSLMRRTKCKQKFMQRRLLSTNNDGHPVVDYFMLPSACTCTYINDYSFIWKLR